MPQSKAPSTSARRAEAGDNLHRLAGRGSAMSDDPKIVEFPKAEVPPEERARRLKVEVERLAACRRASGCSSSSEMSPKSTACRALF